MAATDLCTLADVRQLMQKKVGDVGQDAMIGVLITRASAAITRYCRREFAPAVVSATRYVPVEGDYITLDPWDLRTVTAIDGGATIGEATVLDVATVVLLPGNGIDGTYTALRVPGLTLGTDGRGVAKITGAWGFAAVPGDVAHACALTVVHWLNVNVAAFRSPDDMPEGAQAPRRGIPPEAWSLIEPYRHAGALG